MTVETFWTSSSAHARLARAALTPVSWLFGAVSAARNWAYDRGLLRVTPSPIPVVSVGNLTVGGTGKTPVTSWLATQLRARGERPAIVLRGYGGDEPRVHALLTPDIPVYANPDRVAAIAEAAARGATIVVLDDGMQHRRAGRRWDLVLVSADAWARQPRARLLPAGPYREPLRALRRASMAIVTDKAAPEGAAAAAEAAIARVAPSLPVTTLRIALGDLMDARASAASAGTAARVPPASLAGQSVAAIAGVGDPDAFFAQLAAFGALVTPFPYPDHHAYTASDAADLAARASGHKYVVTTLKDAVKLAPLWPAKGPALWYVSQAVSVNDAMSETDTPVLNLFASLSPTLSP